MANINTLVVNGMHVTTGNYKEDPKGKFTRDVKRKTVYITGPDEQMKLLEKFGMTIYTPNDKDAKPFAMAPFTAMTKVYYEDIKQVESVEFDDKLPNYEMDDVSIALMQGTSAQGQDFFRVRALRVKTAAFIRAYEPVMFDDDNDFIETTNDAGVFMLPGAETSTQSQQPQGSIWS